jgi:hypothetical protein
MPTGYTRAAYESIPGSETNSPTLSTKVLYPPLTAFGVKPGTDPMERDDELRNQDEPLSVLAETYDPTWSVGQRAYPDSLAFWLKLVCGAPTTTAGNGVITDLNSVVVPTGAYRHRWTAPFGPSGASPLTCQFDVAYKDQSVFYKAKGAAASSFSLESPDKGGAMIAASGPAVYLDRQADPSLTPAFESLAIRPFTRGGLTLATDLTGHGTTQDFSVSITNPVSPYRSLSAASRWADVMEKDNQGPIAVTASIPRRQLDADDIDALKNATGFPLLAMWISESIIASAYPYKFFVKFDNAQYVEGDPDDLQNQRRHGHTFTAKSTTTSTGSTTLEVVNATTSYA